MEWRPGTAALPGLSPHDVFGTTNNFGMHRPGPRIPPMRAATPCCRPAPRLNPDVIVGNVGAMKTPLASLFPWALACVTATAHADNMKAFPAAEAGMKRHVLELPPRKDESAFKVELVVGKTVRTDPVNRFFFAGKIEEETIQGWGFPKYTVRSLGPLAGTRMAANPQAPATPRFITLGGEPFLLPYNSRLPVVVYVPEDAEVRYRLWKADGAPKPVPSK